MFFFILRIVNQILVNKIAPKGIVKGKNGILSYTVPFRCWPIDLDAFMHMNNASYIRVAELGRWAVFTRSKTLDYLSQKGILFLVAEQKATYLRPIPPFTKYYLSNSVSFSDNKWMHFRHTFMSHPPVPTSSSSDKDNTNTKEPVIYAVVECKAVLKSKTGKTIKADEIIADNEFYREMHVNNDKL